MGSSGQFQCIGTLSSQDQSLFTRFAAGPAAVVPHTIVHEAFEHQVDANPSTVAAKYDGKTITYASLDEASNRLANYLIESGLKPQGRVCLVVQRSIEMLIGILAILKSGCQYVPLDGGVVSNEALQHTLSDTGASFVLALPKFQEKVKLSAKQGVRIINLGVAQGESSACSRPSVPVSPSDGAYAIYTSGGWISQCGGSEINTLQEALENQRVLMFLTEMSPTHSCSNRGDWASRSEARSARS